MKTKILKMLLDSKQYVSGEEMSRGLGISRAAIWKHIKTLKNDGYEIESVTRKGYKLITSPENVSPEGITSELKTEFIAKKIHSMGSTDSTNEAAKRRFDDVDGTLFTAEIQTAGKGRLGRTWESPRGDGVWMSLLLKPEIPLQLVSQITLIAGVAVCRAIGNGAKIKWPNDIVIGSKKVCGILTEMSAEIDRVNYVICGIGINVNTSKFPDELSEKATSVFLETGEKINRNNLIAKIMNEFEPLYKSFLKDGLCAVIEEYRSKCVNLGRRVQVIYNNKTIIGTACDVSDDGGLIVETDKGKIAVTSGEVSVRGIYGYI